MVDALPLRRVAAMRLPKTLDRIATVVQVDGADGLRRENWAGSYPLAILNLGAGSLGDPAVAARVAAIREGLAATPLAVVSDLDEPAEVIGAFRAGVQGFLPTSSPMEVAVKVYVRRVMRKPGTALALSAPTGPGMTNGHA